MSKVISVGCQCLRGDCDCTIHGGANASRDCVPPFHDGCDCFTDLDVQTENEIWSFLDGRWWADGYEYFRFNFPFKTEKGGYLVIGFIHNMKDDLTLKKFLVREVFRELEKIGHEDKLSSA